jgi:hypothetical protein
MEPNIHYNIHKGQPLIVILRKMNPIHSPSTSLIKIVLILSSHLRLDFPTKLLKEFCDFNWSLDSEHF